MDIGTLGDIQQGIQSIPDNTIPPNNTVTPYSQPQPPPQQPPVIPQQPTSALQQGPPVQPRTTNTPQDSQLANAPSVIPGAIGAGLAALGMIMGGGIKSSVKNGVISGGLTPGGQLTAIGSSMANTGGQQVQKYVDQIKGERLKQQNALIDQVTNEIGQLRARGGADDPVAMNAIQRYDQMTQANNGVLTPEQASELQGMLSSAGGGKGTTGIKAAYDAKQAVATQGIAAQGAADTQRQVGIASMAKMMGLDPNDPKAEAHYNQVQSLKAAAETPNEQGLLPQEQAQQDHLHRLEIIEQAKARAEATKDAAQANYYNGMAQSLTAADQANPEQLKVAMDNMAAGRWTAKEAADATQANPRLRGSMEMMYAAEAARQGIPTNISKEVLSKVAPMDMSNNAIDNLSQRLQALQQGGNLSQSAALAQAYDGMEKQDKLALLQGVSNSGRVTKTLYDASGNPVPGTAFASMFPDQAQFELNNIKTATNNRITTLLNTWTLHRADDGTFRTGRGVMQDLPPVPQQPYGGGIIGNTLNSLGGAFNAAKSALVDGPPIRPQGGTNNATTPNATTPNATKPAPDAQRAELLAKLKAIAKPTQPTQPSAQP